MSEMAEIDKAVADFVKQIAEETKQIAEKTAKAISNATAASEGSRLEAQAKSAMSELATLDLPSASPVAADISPQHLPQMDADEPWPTGDPAQANQGADHAADAEQGRLADLPVHIDGDPGDSTLIDTLKNPDIKSAVDQTWTDSQAENYDSRHEEGGWLIRNDAGESRLERVPSGSRNGLNPGAQPGLGKGEQIEGFVHTHPNPLVDEKGEPWHSGLSSSDKKWSDATQIPVAARSATDLHVYFPG